MDSILNEITYSDGRMDMQKTEFVDTPAKLKLRAHTYDGIQKNLNSRRGCVVKEFNIPSAYMAMDTTSDGGNGGFTIVTTDLENRQLMSSPITKRLKISIVQRNLFAAKSLTGVPKTQSSEVIQPTVETQPVIEEPAVSEVVETAPVVEDVTPNIPTVEVQPVENTPTIEEKSNIDAQIDAAREKVLHTVEQAEPFAKLQKVTEEYGAMNDEIKRVEEQLEASRKGLGAFQDKYSEIGKNLESQETELHERMEAISQHEKETAKINDEIAEVNKKIEEKTRYVETLVRKRAEEKAKIEEELKRVETEQNELQNKISDSEEKSEELRSRSVSLKEQENQALDARNAAQKLLDEKRKLLEAITIPDVDEKTEVEEQASSMTPEDVVESKPLDVVDFPTVPLEETIMEEDGPTLSRSLGRTA